ncbi:MAG: HlyD family efflux transporter periplasmic adaptor subunit [Rudaea sp.]
MTFPKMTRNRILAIVAGVIAVIAAALAFRPGPIRVDLARAERGPLTMSFEEQGKTEMRHHYVVAAPAAGTLHRITLEQGDVVHVDDVVAQMDPAHSALLDPATRANTAAQLAAAAADVDSAASRLAAAVSADDLAQKELGRIEQLRKTGAVSQAALDEARSNSDRAHAARKAAEADRRAAEQRRKAFTALLADQGRGGGTTLDLHSPIDGVVLHRYVESAVPVTAGQPLLELGDPRDLDIEVDTLSQDAVKLRPGMAARVIRWGGDTPLDARVWRIEPGGFTKISALGVEEQRTRVRLDLTSPPEQWQQFGDAYRVEVEFLLAQGADLLQVPSSALFRENGRFAVYRVVDGRARKCYVEIGLRGAAATEIRSGLAPDDTVVAHPDDRIADGIRVEASSEERR